MDGRRARNVLGVAFDAGPDDIRRAFRARAQLTHPDHGGSSHAFTEAVAAFDSLRDVADPSSSVRTHMSAPLTAARHVDMYDSAPRPRPRRDFADVLRAAQARLG